MTKTEWKFITRAVHIGNHPDRETGAVSPPLYLTSTYQQDAVGQDRGYDYSRAVNPTRQRLETNLAALENGAYSVTFASGMAATNALFQLLDSGDHVVMSRNVYGGTYRLAEQVLRRRGLSFDYVDTREVDNVATALRPHTKVVFVETPTNPLLELVDIAAVAQLCHERGVLLVVDNTFMSPYGQRPLELGADVVLHSSTKYLGGHSDILGGVLVMNDGALAERLAFIQKAAGAVPSPFDCWLLLRSTKTLALRVQRQADNALALARWLATLPELERVIYPGLSTHPQHALARRQQRTPAGEPLFGSIISIDLGSPAKRDEFLAKLKLFLLAESLGGVESLVSNPFVMTHGDVPEAEKLAMGITEGLVRLSVGIEDLEDLQMDLAQALG
jgi:cystathionine beta-lyase/cystathionine gamma-synthase